MDKRIVLAVAGVVIVAAVAWLTTRVGEPGAAEQVPSASTTDSVTPERREGAAASVDSPALSAAARPAVSADAPVVTQPGGTSPPQAMGEPLPIDVSPGFEYLNTPATEMKDTDGRWPHWRRHQQLQSEPRDEAWAPRMEATLRTSIQDSLTARGLDTQRIELPVVECHTNGCEIQALGYVEDNGKPGVDFQFILNSLIAGNLGSEFDRDEYSMMLSGRPDRRITFLAQLPRKKP